MNKFIRKIRKVSTHSYAITLPKSIIKKWKWKERQKVELLVKDKNRKIVIKDWERGK